MKRSVLNARIFGLIATTLVATAAQFDVGHAQTVVQPTPPEHYTLDARGVDLVSGRFTYETTEVVIGQPSQGGLAQTRGNYGNQVIADRVRNHDFLTGIVRLLCHLRPRRTGRHQRTTQQ